LPGSGESEIRQLPPRVDPATIEDEQPKGSRQKEHVAGLDSEPGDAYPKPAELCREHHQGEQDPPGHQGHPEEGDRSDGGEGRPSRSQPEAGSSAHPHRDELEAPVRGGTCPDGLCRVRSAACKHWQVRIQ